MPPEVLGEIFWWTLPAEALDRGWSVVKDSPWTLTHVSHRWRAIASSTPSLWSLVVIDYSTEDAYPLAMVKTQIDRAQTLKIHFYGAKENDCSPQIKMLGLLSKHSTRWEELFVELTAELAPHLTALRGRLPALRRLWVQWHGSDSQEGVSTINCFQTAPSLVDIVIFNQYRFVPTLLPIHQQITRYSLDAPWGNHSEILKLAPNLVEGRIVVAFDDEPWPDPPNATIDLSCLRRLYANDVHILEYLRAPALEEVALRVGEEDGPHMGHCLEIFLTRSSCPLRRLCLGGSPNADSTAQILRKCPSITEIAIMIETDGSDDDSDDDSGDEEIQLESSTTFTTHLSIFTNRNEALSPQLSEISFGCWQTRNRIDYSLYLEMLESRWKADNCALRSANLLVRSSLKPDPATLGRLDALKQAGLDLSFVSGPEAHDNLTRWEYKYRWE
ncbi:hypothetical protein B0H11DRAFT_1998823 [Mycena galericulata]|nr:hypothetical protein B0H11DRAFT_1998823 [Mycena galericulata]